MPKVDNGIIYRMKSPSGKFYIGKTITTLKRRIQHHVSKANNKKSGNWHTKLSSAIRKYGSDLKWIVIHKNVLDCDMNALEVQEISIYGSYENGYNSTLGGDGGGFVGLSHSEETKKILSARKSGGNNPMHGKSGKENPFFGKKHTDTSRKKISESHYDVTGENNPMYGKTSAMKGKKHSPEAIEKMRTAARKRSRDSKGRMV